MPLDEDNQSHQQTSNNWDNNCSLKSLDDKAAQPIVHGSYHAGRYVNSGNSEEWARAKNQFSKVGSGQSRIFTKTSRRCCREQ